MFSPGKIDRKLEALSLNLVRTSPFDPQDRPIFKPGFALTRHSLKQVEQANSHLETLKGRGPNTDEIRWILNERNLCAADFTYWATRYATIVNKDGQLVKFDPNLPQRILLDVMAKLEADDLAILVQVLKARQEGVTTLAELILLWRTTFYPYTNSLVASSRPEKSAEMVQKMEICYANQPEWLIPKVGSYSKGEFIGFDKIHSKVHIGHGAMMSGLGRSFTVHAFHLSEVAEFTNPEESIDAALLKGAHDSPWLFGILEGTGQGRSGYWYDKWQYSVEHFPLHESRLCPVFLPWYLMEDMYPNPTELRARPVNFGTEIPDLVLAHARKAKEYVQSGQNQLVTQALGSGWEMPIEKMWYWWLTRKEHAANNTLNVFYQELCADDKEAFQSPNRSIFPIEVTEQFRQFAKMPIGVYGIQAPQAEVPILLQARQQDIDPNQKPIDIRCSWSPTGPSHEYRLVPLLHRGAAAFSPNGKIILYEKPIPGETYALGTDTGFGLGEDASVIQILRKGSTLRNDEQVGEFASPAVNSFTLWPFNLALGTLYSTSVGGKLRQARQVIEGAANGENVYNELKKRGWREFHNWVRYDKKRVDEGKANRQLWYTTSWSRPLMFDMLLDALNNGWLEINSPWFIDEMSDLELVEERARLQAAASRHDDRIMAMGIALFSLHALETRSRDGWVARRTREEGEEIYATWSPGEQASVLESEYQGIQPDTSSYRYRVVTGRDPRYDDLAEPGATIWTP